MKVGNSGTEVVPAGLGEETVSTEMFRTRVREFLDTHALRKPEVREGAAISQAVDLHRDIAAAAEYQAALFDAGFAGLTEPKEYGGQGLADVYQTIFNEEAARYVTADRDIYVIGVGMCVPTLLAHGTEQLKQRYVRPALRGVEVWCQLFSEPAAGSDLAALRTSGVRDGDDWVLNGQKVWTSGAHYCDFGLALARTDRSMPKHKGLSMFVVDMHAPGVTVRPLRQMNGDTHFSEVFLDEVRVPGDHIVGEPGEGWKVALTTLMNERVALGAGRSAESTSPLSYISMHLEIARRRGMRHDLVARQELADLVIRHWILDMMGLRIRGALESGRPPGPEGSVAKLATAMLARRSADVACRLAGAGSMAWPSETQMPEVSQILLWAARGGIAGGTNEVMRNILGERVLGLPKEPGLDRNTPFSELPYS